MKYIAIKDLSFSKILCGTNALYGRSHFSQARDKEYSCRNNEAGIRQVISRCLDFGINAVESCANEKINFIIADLRKERNASLRFIGSTRLDETSEMKSHPEKLNYLLEHRTDIS